MKSATKIQILDETPFHLAGITLGKKRAELFFSSTTGEWNKKRNRIPSDRTIRVLKTNYKVDITWGPAHLWEGQDKLFPVWAACVTCVSYDSNSRSIYKWRRYNSRPIIWLWPIQIVFSKVLTFGLVLWHINHCRLFNAKFIFINIDISISNKSV